MLEIVMLKDSETTFAPVLESVKQATLSQLLRDIDSLARNIAPDAEVCGRIKSDSSAAHKRRTGHLHGTQVLDVIGIRVIVGTKEQCYCMLARIQATFSVIACESDDYIKAPKPNGYRSLHTTIVSADDRSVEVQIRTREMHTCAERGTASHHLYKQALGAIRIRE